MADTKRRSGFASRLPRRQTTAPAGGMSSPHWDVLLLAAPGSQIFDDGRWWTIAQIKPCRIERHPTSCAVFLLPADEERIALHWQLTDWGWIRHPVTGGQP